MDNGTHVVEISLPYDPYRNYGQTEQAQRPTEKTLEKTGFLEKVHHSYRAVSWIFGFREKYSLLLLIVFGGALIGFCLARSIMMNPANVRNMTISGEWFWYRQSLYKPCIFIHIYASIISGIFAVFQFLPAIRRRNVALHRLNGYLTLLLLIPSTIAGAIVARRAFGGDLNVQSSFYTIGLMIIFSAAMGITNVKRTRLHRKWMLRTVTFAATPVTARITSIIARHVISIIGSYYAVWRCDQVYFVLNSPESLAQSFPECFQALENDKMTSVYVAVHASIKENGLGYGSAVRATFGMALWLATVIHTVGIETYLRKTESSNQHRRGFVLERLAEGESEKRAPDDM
jgi:hypothetical protein